MLLLKATDGCSSTQPYMYTSRSAQGKSRLYTVSENHSKSLVLQHCERSELCLFIFGAKIQIFYKKSFLNFRAKNLSCKFDFWHENSNIRKIHHFWILGTFDVKIDIFAVIFRYFFELFRMYFYSSKDSSESRLCSPKFPRDSKMPTRAHDHLIWRPLCFLRMLQNSLNCFIRLIWWAMSTNICSCVG